MILVFYALRRELSALRKRISDRSALSAGARGFKGRLGGEEIFLVVTGIGIAQARESARRALLALPPPRLVISTGVAGGLSPDLKAGDLVLADRLLLESEADSAYEEVWRIAPQMLRSAQTALGRAGLMASAGPMLTARRVLPGAAAKRAAYARSSALAVDMESAAIAIEAGHRGFPFVCLRAVIDEADDEIPGAELADENGNVSTLKAAAYFVRNPSALVRVPAILKNLGCAAASIASALEALCAGYGR